MITGTLLAFFHPETPAKASHPAVAALTFAERVTYQRAIEEVYWRHRIWPGNRGENPHPKPSLDAVISQAQLEKKVEDYLLKSQTLEDYWRRPITSEQLQAEIDRMASHTKQPEVLRELFEALGNDPFVIAECLARPALAERDLTTIAPLNLSLARVERQIGKIQGASAKFTLPTIPNGVECVADTWRPTSIQAEGRHYHTAVWTGSEMIIWGGSVGSELNTEGKNNLSVDSLPMLTPQPTATTTPIPYVNTGARYSPATDSWTATNLNAPVARVSHTAVWTGTEMIVWGGYDGLPPTGYTNSGGRYNPTSDTWSTTSFANAPIARSHHTAVWDWKRDDCLGWV